MERFIKVIAKHYKSLPPAVQDQVDALLYKEGLSYDREAFTGFDREWERQIIRRRICATIRRHLPKRLSVIRWYGGKASHLDFILPHLPEAHTYVEPYGGSAAVLLNRPPSRIDVLNDLDEELINFFRVLRNPETSEPLINLLMLTPYSRTEFNEAITPAPVGHLSDLERARRFFVRASQVRNGLAQCAKSSNWSYPRHGVNKNLEGSLSKVANLPQVVDRLKHVMIENLPALEVIARYDSPNALFYLDPTYVWSTRSGQGAAYHNEMSDFDHRQLAAVLNAIQGRAAISGYDSPLYDELYKGWNRYENRPKRKPSGYKVATEVLWTNY